MKTLIAATLFAAAAVASDAEPGVEDQRRAFLEDPVAPTLKPAGYDVTIVEYTDYQCPYCRAAHGALKRLTATDRKVRLIYRDWPIFGPQSERTARLAIASQWQGKHAVFHDALMQASNPLTEQALQAAARRAGVNWAKLNTDLAARRAEVEALLERNDRQANDLGLNGTPGFIIGNTLYPGGMDLARLHEAVADARAETTEADRPEQLATRSDTEPALAPPPAQPESSASASASAPASKPPVDATPDRNKSPESASTAARGSVRLAALAAAALGLVLLLLLPVRLRFRRCRP